MRIHRALAAPETIENVLRDHPDWHLAGGKLIRDCQFPDFLAAMAFVQEVAVLAEEADHHPDIDIRYNHVRLGLISHDARGITRRDLSMVQTLDDRFEKRSQERKLL